MRVAAYDYAETPGSNPIPRELVLLGYIDRFGAQAVMGRQLNVVEIRRMILVDNICRAYDSRSQAEKNGENWAAWAKRNPKYSQILENCMHLEDDQ